MKNIREFPEVNESASTSVLSCCTGAKTQEDLFHLPMKKQPSVLLLDELTSGLDSGGSMELIRVLRQLADDRGITVVAVIHQPSFALLALFDWIVLLSKGGRMAYAGPVKSRKSYFEDLGFVFNSNENAVDVCLDAVSG